LTSKHDSRSEEEMKKTDFAKMGLLKWSNRGGGVAGGVARCRGTILIEPSGTFGTRNKAT